LRWLSKQVAALNFAAPPISLLQNTDGRNQVLTAPSRIERGVL